MAITIGSNIASLAAQRQLGKATESLSSSFEKLSSGLRINKASDDAAGLAVSLGLDISTRVFTQGLRNINDGISALSIAEGALQELSLITTRQKELATQAANGVYSLTQRKALDAEANALGDEFNRIVQTTKFNNVQLLAGNSPTVSIQLGFGTSGTIGVDLGDGLERLVGDGTFGAATSYPGQANVYSTTLVDINNDGKVDILSSDYNGLSFSTYLGNGDGTFKVRTSIATGPSGATRWVTVGDFNNDGKVDVAAPNNSSPGTVRVYLGNNDGTFKAPISSIATGNNTRYVAAADLNGDGLLDMVSTEVSSAAATVYFGNGDGSFKAGRSYATGTNPYQVAIADLNGDGIFDLATPDNVGGTVSVLLGNFDGSFRARISLGAASGAKEIAARDFNHDGFLDLAVTDSTGFLSIYNGNGDGTYSARVSYVAVGNSESLAINDFNGDGVLDVATGDGTSNTAVILLGNSDGTFKAGTSFVTGNAPNISSGDVNGDSVNDLVSSNFTDGTIGVLIGNSTRVTTVARPDLLSRANALEALNTLSATQDRIGKELGNIGSSQSRLEIASRALANTRDNNNAASSRIVDVDVAQETANLSRNRILQQAGAAILAQANQIPALALILL